MIKTLTGIAFWMLISGFLPAAEAAGPLSTHCHQVNGTLITGHYINNLSVKKSTGNRSDPMSMIQILYDNQWYENSGNPTLNILSTAEVGLLLHKEIDICVKTTNGLQHLIGIQFTSVF